MKVVLLELFHGFTEEVRCIDWDWSYCCFVILNFCWLKRAIFQALLNMYPICEKWQAMVCTYLTIFCRKNWAKLVFQNGKKMQKATVFSNSCFLKNKNKKIKTDIMECPHLDSRENVCVYVCLRLDKSREKL